LKGLLETVGFEMTTEGVRTGTRSESWEEVNLLAAVLKLRLPKEGAAVCLSVLLI